MKAIRHVCVLSAAGLASTLALACSQDASGPSGEGQVATALKVCVLDGAVCVDLPDVYVPPLPFDGGFPFPDVNLPPLPPLTDAGFPQLPDTGLPPLPTFDGGLPTFDAGADACDPLNIKYVDEYVQSFKSGQPMTSCGSCAASECCFAELACVPK